MAVTEYKPSSTLGCRYSYDKLENVVYLVSKSHVKDVHIDNGEAYIEDLTEVPLRIEGFNIQFTEDSSLDERYKFTKQVNFSIHGYVNHLDFNDRYYVILKSKDGTKWMVNVDFPSKVTYTFNLNATQYQTDFTFSSVSNFPTLRLATEIGEGNLACKQLRTFGIESLKMLEKDKCSLDTKNKVVYTYGDSFVDVDFLTNSCSLQESFDGEIATTTISFNIGFDAYKSSWHYNLLEFLENLYSAIIKPKGEDNTFFSGFNFGLQPSFNVSTTSEAAQSDIITVTLIEASSQGSTSANEWSPEEDTDKRWIYITNVGDILGYECVGLGVAKYLLQQEISKNGVPTGRYKALVGYESQFPTLNIIGTFSVVQEFSNPNCQGAQCAVQTDLPISITYYEATCYTYSYSASCNWNVSGLASYMTVTPSNGIAGQSYTLSVCNTKTPTENESSIFTIVAGDNPLVVNVNLSTDSSFIRPQSININCLQQNVAFSFDAACPITVTDIDSRLTYQITTNNLIVNVPRNYSIESGITWTIGVKDCHDNTTNVTIVQDKTYENWVNTSDIICDGSTSYVKQQRYTGTTSTNINTATVEVRTGAKIQDNDSRCGSYDTKWEESEFFYCLSGDKWSFEEEYIRYQGGSWQKTGQTRLKTMVESASTFCNESVEYKWVLTNKWICYDNKLGVKWLATYSGGTTSSAECDASSAITSGEVTTTDLVEVEIGDCVTTIGSSAFYGCTSLTSIEIPNSVTSIGDNAFINCYSLTSIGIPSGVTSIGGGAFMSCEGLTSCTLPNTVTSIGFSAFYGCTSLTSIDIPDNVTSIGNNAFYYCSNLTSVTVNATTPPTLGADAFTNTSSNLVIYVPSASVNTYKAADGWSTYASIIQAIP